MLITETSRLLPTAATLQHERLYEGFAVRKKLDLLSGEDQLSGGKLQKALPIAQHIQGIYDVLKEQNEEDPSSVLVREVPEIRENIDTFYVYTVDDVVMGCASLHVYKSPDIAELRSVAVRKNLQNTGKQHDIKLHVGRALIAACTSEARARNITEVYTTTNKPEVFLKFGFKESPFGQYVVWRQGNKELPEQKTLFRDNETSYGVRPAKPEDVERIYDLIKDESYEGSILYRDIDDITRNIQHFFVCEEKNTGIVGTISFEKYHDRIGEVWSLVVDKRKRRQGIGSALLRRCEEIIADIHIKEVFATFREDHQQHCLVFFEKNGFSVDKTGKKILWLDMK